MPNRDAPASPKNSPYKRPKITANAEHAPATSASARRVLPTGERWRSTSASAARMSPYPTSPNTMPKNIGKKIARKGVGSMLP